MSPKLKVPLGRAKPKMNQWPARREKAAKGKAGVSRKFISRLGEYLGKPRKTRPVKLRAPKGIGKYLGKPKTYSR